MAYTNANYIQNPNRLSTRVHYAPGGLSSLSLAWNTPTQLPTNKQKSRSVPLTDKYQENIFQRSPQIQQAFYSPYQQEPSQNHKNNYQSNSGYYQDMYSESNRMLEAELRYYQQKNKLFRQNIFGGYNNIQQISKHNMRNQQYSQPYNNNQQRESANYNISGFQDTKKYNQRPDQLQMAVYQQNKKLVQDRQQSTYPQSMGYFSPSFSQQKAHIKINQPPGGRSSIIFG